MTKTELHAKINEELDRIFINGDYDKLKNAMFNEEAHKMATNPVEWEHYLENLIILYINDYNAFLKINLKKIKKIVTKENQELKDFLMKKIRFFNTGLNLITFDNHNLIINKEILENYQQINLQENKSLLKIIKNENEIKDLEKIENNLNLIIKFYKNEKIREEFFKSLFEKKDPIKTLEEKIISQNHNYILLSNNSQR